jgi:hypothetical protein
MAMTMAKLPPCHIFFPSKIKSYFSITIVVYSLSLIPWALLYSLCFTPCLHFIPLVLTILPRPLLHFIFILSLYLYLIPFVFTLLPNLYFTLSLFYPLFYFIPLVLTLLPRPLLLFIFILPTYLYHTPCISLIPWPMYLFLLFFKSLLFD